MSYKKQTFIDEILDENGNLVQEGTVLKAEHLQHIEDGIVAISGGDGYSSMPFEYNENAGVISDFVLLQPAPFDGKITKIHFRQGSPDTARPEITVFDWDGVTVSTTAFTVVGRYTVQPVSDIATVNIPIKKGQYIGVTNGTGTVCRWYDGAEGAGFVYTPEESTIRQYKDKYITLSYEMEGNGKIEQIEEEIDNLKCELSYDSEKWGEATKQQQSEDYIKSDSVEWGYQYIPLNNGTPTLTKTDENWRYTNDYFPVSAGDVLEIKNSIIGHNSVAMFAFYDSGKNYIADYSRPLVKGNYSYTVPKNTNIAYVRFSVGNRTSADVAPTFNTQEIRIIRNVPIETPKENLDNIYGRLQKLDEQTSSVASAMPLKDKIVFLAGDSRSSTDYDFYKTTLEGKCGCIALVKGASGRNVAYNASDEYFARLTSNPHDFSIWIVGGNDTGASGTIGTFSADSVNGKNGEEVVTETDITADYAGTKFVQAIDHMMRKYKALFYNFKTLDNFHIPKMIFCTDLPQQRSNADSAWSKKENWERKRNAIIECAEKNNVALLDLYKLCNFDMSFEPYWVSPTDKVNDNGLYFMDGLHPNKFGIDIITSLEIEEMKKYITVNSYERVYKMAEDGLIMYCDGINNTGAGHSDNITTWTDISGKGNNLINVASETATTPVSSVQGEWLENGMHIIESDDQFLRSVNTFDLGADRTIEMYVTLNANANMTMGLAGADRVKFRSANAAFWARVCASDTDNLQDIRSLGATKYNVPTSVSITRHYDVDTAKTTFKVYSDGVYKNSLIIDGDHRTGESASLIFGLEQTDVTIHSVRVYDRALTAEEIKENYRFDVVHFS